MTHSLISDDFRCKGRHDEDQSNTDDGHRGTRCQVLALVKQL